MIDAPTLEIGSTLAGKYKILRVLGAGGMGAVYLAENLAIARQVAIKVLHARMGRDPATLHRFRQEARATATIGHPGVVDVLDMGETAAGEAFIVMEKLEGQTLGARLKQRHQLSVDETISIVSEALDTIAAAHDKGIIHRDLKPDNLFLVWHPSWRVKILDFGISRFIDADEIRVTASNTVMGSVLYMPPEQAKDARVAGPPADLYALGAVMYHALTGRPPFGGESYSEVLSRVLTDAPAPITALRADLPPELADLVMALLAKQPGERPGPARTIRERLLAMVEQLSPPAEPMPAADALGATLQPADAMAPTADVSTAPLAVTAEASLRSMPDRPAQRPIGVTTGVAAGEVAASAPPDKRRSWVAPAGAIVILAGFVIAMVMRGGNEAAQRPGIDAASARADQLIPGPVDALIPDAVIDAAFDAQFVRPDGRTDRPERPIRPRRADAGVTPHLDGALQRKGSGHDWTDLQEDPP